MPLEELIEALYLALADSPSARLPREAVDELLQQHLGTNVLTLRSRIGSGRLVMPSGRLWTREDVQAYLGVEKTWVQQATADGTLPCVRVSERLTRYRPEDIRAWAERRTRGGG